MDRKGSGVGWEDQVGGNGKRQVRNNRDKRVTVGWTREEEFARYLGQRIGSSQDQVHGEGGLRGSPGWGESLDLALG